MTLQEIIEKVVAIDAQNHRDLWRMCTLIHAASKLGERGKTWSGDLAEALHVTRQVIYDRRNAFEMRGWMTNALDTNRINRAAERGYSYFAVAWNYRHDADLNDLLDAIETASNIMQLRVYLQNRYGNAETVESFVGSSFRKLSLVYGMLEIYNAPDDVRFAVAAAVEAVEAWQTTVKTTVNCDGSEK